MTWESHRRRAGNALSRRIQGTGFTDRKAFFVTALSGVGGVFVFATGRAITRDIDMPL